MVHLASELAKVLKLYVRLIDTIPEFEIGIDLFMQVVFDSISNRSSQNEEKYPDEHKVMNAELVIHSVNQRLNRILNK